MEISLVNKPNVGMSIFFASDTLVKVEETVENDTGSKDEE